MVLAPYVALAPIAGSAARNVMIIRNAKMLLGYFNLFLIDVQNC